MLHLLIYTMPDRVVGIDICRDRVIACCLEALPTDPHEFYQNYEFLEFPLNRAGLEELLALNPTVVLYEPTGLAYSTVWVARLREAGVICKGVDHAKLRAYRKSLGLPDKDDPADALSLGCYYLDPLKQGSRFSFIRQKDPVISEVRRLVLRLQHLDRRKSPIVNRLKQDLAIAFPERMNASCDCAPLFWGWLAGERKSARYDRMLANSIGLGLYPEMIAEAKALTACFREELEITRRLHLLIESDDRFKPYLKVLRAFGFGFKIEALLLSAIYPFEDFLKDGQPEVRIRKGKNSGKPTARHLSLRRFQKALGVAPVREESGDVKKKHRGGSSLCRKALWQWVFTRIEVKRKTSNTIILQVRELHQGSLMQFSSTDVSKLTQEQQKVKGVRVRLARAYTRRKVSIMLFKALVDELCR